jgi:hypothetical protein
MKLAIPCLLALLCSTPALAGSHCIRAAEAAGYKAWYKPGQFVFGRVLGGTEIIWQRGGITSFRVEIEHRKPDSSNFSYAAYYVRMDNNCRLIRAKKY